MLCVVTGMNLTSIGEADEPADHIGQPVFVDRSFESRYLDANFIFGFSFWETHGHSGREGKHIHGVDQEEAGLR